MLPVTVVGSINVDVVVRATSLPAAGETVSGRSVVRLPGGKGANQAVALARLGTAVALVSAVGADDDGSLALASLEAVDSAGVATVAAPTGLALVTVDDSGENTIVVVPGANALVAAPRAAVSDLVVQLEVPLDVAREAVMAATGLVVLNAAPAVPLPPDLLSCVDVLVVNEGEAHVVAERSDLREALDLLVPLVRRGVVVTLGAAGCLVGSRSGVEALSGRPVAAADVVDTIGAGDAFVSALTWALLEGRSLLAAAEVACIAGSLTVGRPGARSSPTRAELEAALAGVGD